MKKTLSFILPALLLAGCAMGPDYKRPETAVPTDYRWKVASPADKAPRGKWWESFGDAELNRLQDMAAGANQDVQAAMARAEQARGLARIDSAGFWPQLSGSAGYQRHRSSGNVDPGVPFRVPSAHTHNIAVPFDLSYEVDLWGRVRRSFEGSRADAEAARSAWQGIQLIVQAELTATYLQLKGLDAELAILTRGVTLRNEQLETVESRFKAGLTSELDATRARNELAVTETELLETERQRGEFENVLALLCGQIAGGFKVESLPGLPAPFVAPPGLPSSLLERRPDIAEAERKLAATFARIGVARTAYFPSLHLTASGGYASADIDTLFSADSRTWSIGPSISIPIFTAGRTKAAIQNAEARRDEALAVYRQRVLVAFKDVENALLGVKSRDAQGETQKRALEAGRQSAKLSNDRYTRGLVNYLEVIDAQRSLLQAERQASQILTARLLANVSLIKALGGGWDGGK